LHFDKPPAEMRTGQLHPTQTILTRLRFGDSTCKSHRLSVCLSDDILLFF
jgi:hypothetical protein